MKTYLVGGAVRDKLLNLNIKDRDWVVVGSTPEQMLALGYQQVGQDFPVFLHPETHEEFALARTERKTGKGYQGFSCHADKNVTLEQDLQRRDLTINAIAEDEQGQLIDPYGGQADLDAGFLRHVSPAFSEDPVRILRIARFAARFGVFGFRVAHSTHHLMKKMVANGEVDALVSERVWQELSRALNETQPQRFFQVLHSCGALEKLLPEWLPLFTADNNHQQKDQTRGSQLLQTAVKQKLNTQQRFALLASVAPQGLTALNSLAQHMKINKSYYLLAEKIISYSMEFKRCDTNNPVYLLHLLEALDSFRRPQILTDFLTIHQCLSSNPNIIKNIKTAYNHCKDINAKALVASGLRGADIGAALNQQRLQAIESMI